MVPIIILLDFSFIISMKRDSGVAGIVFRNQIKLNGPRGRNVGPFSKMN